MKNGQIVEEFARVFADAPELAGAALQEALKAYGYEVVISKKAPSVSESHIYQFPFMTGERSVESV